MKDVNELINNGIDVKASLELLGDMATYDDILNDFLLGVNDKLTQIKKFKEASDMANYAILVHSLKSDAKYLGFKKLADLAYQHELKSKDNNAQFVFDNYESLIEETNNIIKLTSNYLGKEFHLNEEKKITKKDKTILVVDDSNIVSNFINKIFNDDYDVLIANDGKEALDIIAENQTNNIVAMLLDLNMPNVNGFEVLEYFRKHDLFTKIPVSIITGDDSKESLNKSFTYPIVDVLTKPFNERDVKRVINKTLNFN
ncbi:MAG: response regulator [Bacilli bacterium]